LQPHTGKQLQESPQGHLLVSFLALPLWQPHLHAAPGHDTHEHELDLVDIMNLLSLWVDLDINLRKDRIEPAVRD
jgi:hypothetical protein